MQARHAQEPTAVSATETLIDRQGAFEQPSLSPISPFTGSGVQVEGPNHYGQPRAPDHEVTIDPHSFPSVIPPAHDNRTLVLCFDGTGDQFDADNSNIVQLVSLLKKDDKTKQMVYYQSGIGTYTPAKFVTPFLSRIQKTLDAMIAWNLDSHVMAGYRFLMQNYIEGDRICIFGFSRGAYTARSLAGMLHKVGLLPADNIQQVPFAYKMYKRVDHVGWEQSNGFKKAFCIDVDIEFVGVWDTVDSVGIIPRRLPFTTSNTIVRTFRHAVALDEHRAKFKANLWNRPTAEEARLGVLANTQTAEKNQEKDVPPSPVPSLSPSPTTRNGKKTNGQKKREESEEDKKLNAMERIYSAQTQRQTDIEEVWFAGCHCDVGGGSVSNKTRHSLGRISLRWMVRECFKAKTGIMFKAEALRQIGLDPATLYPIVTPRPPLLPISSEHKIRKPPAEPIPIRPHATLFKRHPIDHLNPYPEAPMLRSEEEEELHDALSPAYDQLKLKKGWWILEILPMQLRYQRDDNQWVTYFGSNLGRPRYIPQQQENGVKVHRSVKLRKKAEYEAKKGKKYETKARLRVEPTWID